MTLSQSLEQARATYFRENGFGADGGYSSPYFIVRVLGLPVALPNTAARVRAVRLHDLHHILTGYATDLRGECEIAAWELASGCGRFTAAWGLNLSALAGGVFVWPRRLWAAFRRGRQTSNLYRQAAGDFEALLSRDVANVQEELGLNQPRADSLGWTSPVYFAGCVAAGAVLTGLSLVVFPLPLLGLLAGAILAQRVTA